MIIEGFGHSSLENQGVSTGFTTLYHIIQHYTTLYHIIYLLGFDPHDSFTFGYEWALQYELLSRVII